MTLPGLALVSTFTGTPASKSACVVWFQTWDPDHVETRCGAETCLEEKYAWVEPKVLSEVMKRSKTIIPMAMDFMDFRLFLWSFHLTPEMKHLASDENHRRSQEK
jgi:hypothetical protein